MRVSTARDRLLLTIAICCALASFAVLFRSVGTRLFQTVEDGRLPSSADLDCVHDPLPPSVGPDRRPTNYLHTCGGRLYDSHGVEVRLTGLNWSGMENSGDAPGGLGNRNWQELLDQIAALGYNAVRIPFTNETIESGQSVGNVDFALNPDLQDLTGLEVLDRIVEGARRRGLKVILDRHQPTPAGRSTLWYTPEVPEDRWITDWRVLAKRYRGNDAVVGVDLANEPHGGATWGTNDATTDWRLAAERAGDAVLHENPYLLILVEGVEDVGSDHFWWGGNLIGARSAPVRLHVSNRLVYSPHDYGPAISAQPWFSSPSFPANLPGEWDRHWGYLFQDRIAPIVIGEFGGWSFGNDPDGLWQASLLRYVAANHLSAFVWSLNPSWDTGGILSGDWSTVNQAKRLAYRAILAPPIDRGPTGVFGHAATQPHVATRISKDGASGDLNVNIRVFNDGPSPLDLAQVEVRYGPLAAVVNAASMPLSLTTDGIAPSVVSTQFVDQQSQPYVRVSFSATAGVVKSYRGAGGLTLHLRGETNQAHRSITTSSLIEPSATAAVDQGIALTAVYYQNKLIEVDSPLSPTS
jgi:endoglucanase